MKKKERRGCPSSSNCYREESEGQTGFWRSFSSVSRCMPCKTHECMEQRDEESRIRSYESSGKERRDGAAGDLLGEWNSFRLFSPHRPDMR